MNTRKTHVAALALAAGVALAMSGVSQAALQGRDFDGNVATVEAYYDTDLNITWLATANNDMMTWVDAKLWAATLTIVDTTNNLTYDNWRLPATNPINGVSYNYATSYNGTTDIGANISEQGTAYAGSTSSEMAHLFYNTFDNKSYCPVSTNCSPPQYDWLHNNTGPFTNLQAYHYWSGTEGEPGTGQKVFTFYFGDGYQYAGGQYYGFYALAVSDGDIGIAAIPEPETYAMLLAGLGLVGAAVRWRKQAKG